jgi:hypothetical protein
MRGNLLCDVSSFIFSLCHEAGGPYLYSLSPLVYYGVPGRFYYLPGHPMSTPCPCPSVSSVTDTDRACVSAPSAPSLCDRDRVVSDT